MVRATQVVAIQVCMCSIRSIAAALVLLTFSAPRAQEPAHTWRVDFYQTGGPGVEAYSLDRIVVERPSAVVAVESNCKSPVISPGSTAMTRPVAPADAWNAALQIAVLTAPGEQPHPRHQRQCLRMPACTSASLQRSEPQEQQEQRAVQPHHGRGRQHRAEPEPA